MHKMLHSFFLKRTIEWEYFFTVLPNVLSYFYNDVKNQTCSMGCLMLSNSNDSKLQLAYFVKFVVHNLADALSRESKGVVFTATWSHGLDSTLILVTLLLPYKALYDDYLCLVASSKRQTYRTRIQKKYRTNQLTANQLIVNQLTANHWPPINSKLEQNIYKSCSLYLILSSFLLRSTFKF